MNGQVTQVSLKLFAIFFNCLVKCLFNDFSICHDDVNFSPVDGIMPKQSFGTWLGFVQYIHATKGFLYDEEAPRVTLIHKLFALGTAADLLRLPEGYKLGSVVFGDYERDEVECGLTVTQVKAGVRCAPAYIEIPIVDVNPHPEFLRFGTRNSLAIVQLLRPMRSHYMVPICLPTLTERAKKRKNKKIYLVDYISSKFASLRVPRNFDEERMAMKTLKLYTYVECKRHRKRSRLSSVGISHVLCTSGCGVRPGTPIVSHSSDGPFELVGVAAGVSTCLHRSMRQRLNSNPPIYIDVYPYVTWIVNIITAHMMPRPYLTNFQLADAGRGFDVYQGNYLRQQRAPDKGWRSRTYIQGNFCYKPLKERSASPVSTFYFERFEVNSDPATKMRILMKISAGIECKIICVRMTLPNQLNTPVIKGVGRYNISIELAMDLLPYTFYYSLALIGKNSTIEEFNEWKQELAPGSW